MKSVDPQAEANLQRFLSVLAHMGWGFTRQARPQPLAGGRECPAGAAWVALPLAENHPVLAVAVPSALPDPAESFRHFEDIAPLHRALLRTLREQALAVHSLIVLDGRGAHLLDAENEDLLLAAPTREETEGRLLPLLDVQAAARGSLVSYPRKSVRQRARELADWTRLWTTRFGGRLDLSRSLADRFFQWLHLARLAEYRPAGPHPAEPFDRRSAPHSQAAARRLVEERFRALHERWFLLQEGPLRAMLDIASEAARTGELEACLQSYALLSRAKFSSEVFAEAFADEELRLLSWRHSLTGEADEVAAASGEGSYSDAPFRGEVPVALDACGTIVLLRVFDRLVDRVHRAALDRASASERGERPGMQLDLLSGPPQECRPEEAARFVLRHLLRPHTASPQRAVLARTILLARCCEWDERLHAAHLPFPRVDPVVTSPPPREAATTVQGPESLN